MAIPTLNELYLSIVADIEAKYGTAIGAGQKTFLRIMAGVQAAKLKLLYLQVGYLQKNIFVDTAQPESVGGTLERFGRVKLKRGPFAAVAGIYDVTVTGDIGGVIEANTVFKADDNSSAPGKLFVLDTQKTLTSTSGTISLRAMESGQDSQLSIGDTLTATIPIANVNRFCTVSAETTEPLAAESIEDYRSKAIEAYRLEPQGGAATDYRLWAADAQGVAKVYPYAKSGAANEINLFIEATQNDSLDGRGTPSSTLINSVEDVVEFDPDTTRPLNERGRRPLGVFEIHYLPVTPLSVDIDIADFVDIDNDKKALILSSITELLSNIRPFVAGADILADKNDIINQNKIIATIISAIPGSVFGAITLEVNGATVSSYQFLNGYIPYMGTITYS